jgi:hypothetical protein
LRAAGISSTPFSELEKLIIQRGRDGQQQPDIYFQISHALTQSGDKGLVFICQALQTLKLQLPYIIFAI